jgi:hypothetical protein
MRAKLASLEAKLARRRGTLTLEQVARTRRWLDEGDWTPLFAEAASTLERAWDEDDTGSVSSWATAGGLWHLAGDATQAQRALRQAAAAGSDWEPMPHGPAGVLYLLGEHENAARLAPDAPEGMLAAAALQRDVALVAAARDRWLAWEKHDKRGPHQTRSPVPLTNWDWIEETFRLESDLRDEPLPSHLEMLRRTGMLRDAN